VLTCLNAGTVVERTATVGRLGGVSLSAIKNNCSILGSIVSTKNQTHVQQNCQISVYVRKMSYFKRADFFISKVIFLSSRIFEIHVLDSLILYSVHKKIDLDSVLKVPNGIINLNLSLFQCFGSA